MNLNSRPEFAQRPSIRSDDDPLLVCFFTLVLNGEPFIRYHLDVLERLSFPWQWHIVEGVAEHHHDTAWCANAGGSIPEDDHRHGLSIDGTSEYLTELAESYPDRVHVHRRENGFWDGKREMANQAVQGIAHPCLLWEIDSDELWTAAQIERCRQLFLENPEMRMANFWCHYFVGPRRVIVSPTGFSRQGGHEWRRVWRFEPGMRWASHEPPSLTRKDPNSGEWVTANAPAFSHAQTEAAGLVFQHFSLATEQQVRFKETYYGHRGAMEGWSSLQRATCFPRALHRHLSWVDYDTVVDEVDAAGVDPLAEVSMDGAWQFHWDKAATGAAGFWRDRMAADLFALHGLPRAWQTWRLAIVLNPRLRCVAKAIKNRLRAVFKKPRSQGAS